MCLSVSNRMVEVTRNLFSVLYKIKAVKGNIKNGGSDMRNIESFHQRKKCDVRLMTDCIVEERL